MTFEILVPIIVVAATVLGSVWVATYNNRKASERVAQEANRAKKAEAYRTFMNVLLKAMGAVKSGKDPNPVLAETFLNLHLRRGGVRESRGRHGLRVVARINQ